MLSFIAEIKEKLKEEGIDASYLCITNNLRDGIRIGDSLVFFELAKGNQYVVRIFAPKDIRIKRVNEVGNSIVKDWSEEPKLPTPS